MTANQYTIELSEMERDIIGEVMNISMGAAATAMSTILDKKVSITTPRLTTEPLVEFEFDHLEPVLGVLIEYVEGIGGTNLLLLKVDDFKKILSHLLGMDMSDVTEFDEISISAICEIMNQMMGSAAGALATFLGTAINISPPEILETTDKEEVQSKFTVAGSDILSIAFDIQIENLVKSEFISIMEPALAKEIIRMSLGENTFEEAAPEPEPAPLADPIQEAVEEDEISYSSPVPGMTPATSPLPAAAVAPQQPAPVEQTSSKPVIQAVQYSYPDLQSDTGSGGAREDNNLQLILSVPIQITVELGKTRRKIKDIAEFAPGNIIELDRQAGDQVDIVANGRLIAKGDVVVVDDNYSVRITEIMRAREQFAETK